MCNGEFLDKEPDEALEYLDHLVENSQSWHSVNSSEGSIRSNLANSNKEKSYLSQEDDLNARIASLTRKVEGMELKKVNKIKYVQEEKVCSNCELIEHSTNECPNIPLQSNFMIHTKNLFILHISKLTIHMEKLSQF